MQIDGSFSAGNVNAHGLNLSAGGSTVRGLIVSGFGGRQITAYSDGNLFQGNWLGLNADGAGAGANGVHGLSIGGAYNVVGGTTAAERNVASGNGVAGGAGIVLETAAAVGNRVVGNRLGTNAAGTAAVPNGHGVWVGAGAGANTIGGGNAGEGNLIAGNAINGVLLQGGGGTQVQGNRIGTNAAGTAGLRNGLRGVYVNGGGNHAIGGASAGQGNLISGNGRSLAEGWADTDGGVIVDAGATGITIAGNTIGLAADGLAALGNGKNAIYVTGTSAVTVGGATTAHRNLIAASGSHGVYIGNNGSAGATVQNNWIGLAADGATARGNGTQASGDGVVCFAGAVNNCSVLGNVIASSSRYGVWLATGTGHTVRGNLVGTDSTGTLGRGNASVGVYVTGSGTNAAIGGTTAADRNVVSANGVAGIRFDAGATGSVSGNYIGTNATGTAALGNTGPGVHLNGAANVTVGGAAAGAGNVISGAAGGSNGVRLELSTATGNMVQGNLIGANAANTAALGNTGSGIGIVAGASGNTIGGTAAGQGNVIRGSGLAGVGFAPGTTATNGNRISGNSVFGNGEIGIRLRGGVSTPLPNDGALNGDNTQGNRGMDSPVLTAASSLAGGGGTTLTVAGHVGSAAGQSTFGGATVEVFVSDNDGSGFGEGQTYLGTLTAAANGTFSGSITVPAGVTLTPGSTRLTATATDAGGNTSEFGANFLLPFSITGTVFEDVNYGGGPGRGRAASGTVARPGATVELYTVSGGTATFQAGTTTDAAGAYVFGNLGAGTYAVRVVGSTVSSSRSGWTASLRPVMTARHDWTANAAVLVADHVGGLAPAAGEAAAATAGAAFATATGTFSSGPTGTAQAFTLVTLNTVNGAGLDFGFNFGTVTNTNATGAGSLRQVVANANALGGDAALAAAGRTAGIEHVVFMISNGSTGAGGSLNLPAGGLRSTLNLFASGVATVTPGAELAVSTPMVIDAQTQPGWTTRPIVELVGTGAGNGADGFWISGGGSAVRGFVINRWPDRGLSITGPGGNTVQGNWIGVNAAGTAASSNGAHGVFISGSPNNLVGGNTATQRNVLSGNAGDDGLEVNGAGASGNTIRGNYIGLAPDGQAALGNGHSGIAIVDAPNTVVGGSGAGEGNVIGSNGHVGVFVGWGGQLGAVVQGNTIGLAADGSTARGNGWGGLLSYAGGGTIGGSSAGARNTVSANGGYGIRLEGGTANVVQGNWIGLQANGSSARGNGSNGLEIAAGTAHVVGGIGAAGNVISGNTQSGVSISGGTATLQGNLIGTNAAGDVALGNQGQGIGVVGVSDIQIGGSTAGAGNLVSGNAGGGVQVTGGAQRTVLEGNQIGTNLAGTAALPNGVAPGVLVWGNAQSTRIGGTAAGAGNLISGNLRDGVMVGNAGSAASGTLIQGNRIGTNAAGSGALPNGQARVSGEGVSVGAGSSGTTIGGTAAGAGNVISGNHNTGIYVYGGASTTTIQGNLVGLNAAGTAALPNVNYSGIWVSGGASTTLIGGTAAGAGNTISGNGPDGGIYVESGGGAPTGVTIQGNVIGGRPDASAAIPNTGPGVTVNAVTGVLVGGTGADMGNRILANVGAGVRVLGNAQARIAGNAMWANTTLGIDLGGDGATANDGTTTSGQPNRRMDAPVLTTAIFGAGAVEVAGYVGDAPGRSVFASARVEFFAADSSAGAAQGRTYLGFLTTDASGNFSGTLTGVATGPGFIVGTATDASGNTSEFGPVATVTDRYTVTHTQDGAATLAGSLRWAITNALADAGVQTVRFNLPTSDPNHASGVWTITPLSALPALTDGSAVDASTQPGYGGVPLVQLRGASAGASANGLQFTTTAGGVVRGLVINGFGGCAVRLDGPGGHTVAGNFIGTTITGSAAASGNGAVGVCVNSPGNTVGGTGANDRNVVGGFLQVGATQGRGIDIGAGADGNTVAGNWVGLGADGVTAVANQSGLLLSDAGSNTIGGATAAHRNVISGNQASGVTLQTVGGSASGNTVAGNRIGTNAAGTAAVANGTHGVVLGGSVAGTTVGGSAAGAGNLVSGNGGRGVIQSGAGVSGTVLRGNWIGLNAAGTAAVPNAQGGVELAAGGALTISGNVVSGNTGNGVTLSAGTGSVVHGNRIGTNASGTAAVPNTAEGIRLGGAQVTQVGGTGAGEGNVVSGNGTIGVNVLGASASTVLQANIVGLAADGTAALGNTQTGVSVSGPNTTVGGATAASRNVIAANGSFATGHHGINACAGGLVIRHNHIGTDATGTLARGNGNDGIAGCNGFTGTVQVLDNVISGNGRSGVFAWNNGSTTPGAGGTWTLLRNTIGRNATDTANLPNGVSSGGGGVSLRLNDAQVGDGTAANANTIAGNTGPGVAVIGGVATGNRIRGNRVFGNSTVGIDLGTASALNGATANDGARTTGQPNQLMDSPVLTRAVLGSDTLAVVGYVGSAALQGTFGGALVDLYVSSGGQGQTYLGTVTANADGEFAGVVSTAGVAGLAAGSTQIVATATDAGGNTSEFGPALTTVALAAFQNGGFETPAGRSATLATGDASLTGWVVTGTNVDQHNHQVTPGFWLAPEGSAALDLSGTGRGGVAQVLATTPGQVYTATFRMAGNPGVAPTVKTLRVTAGATVRTLTFDTSATSWAAMGWVDRSVTFTASAEATLLWFEGLDASTRGVTLDHVRLAVGASATASLSGTVFEDPNYGGGSGRARAAASGSSPRPGARVELFDAGGNLVATTTTDAGGAYSFTNRALGSYTVRVVSGTVSSSRSGWVGTLVPTVTYRTDASGGTALPDTAFVGGANPLLGDAGNAGTALAALDTAGTTAQAVAPVQLAGDLTGLDFGFSFNVVTNTRDGGSGSLRQAITNANTLGGDGALAMSGRSAGTEHLVFMLPNGTSGGGLRSAFDAFTTNGGSARVATFTPASQYPGASAGLVLDAQTQPGWSTRPLLEISGALLPASQRPLSVTGANVVRGFILNRAPAGTDGLRLDGDNHVVQGNWIGLDATGTAAAANGRDGIVLAGVGATIGGTTATQRNVISGNGRFGIDDVVTGAGNHLVVGNYIGTDAGGGAAVPNGDNGVNLDGSSGNRVGGLGAGEGNVISGNAQGGLNGGPGIVVQGNWIGLAADGSAALPNARTGVYVGGANSVVQSNVVSANGGSGVVLAAAASGSVLRGNLVGLASDGGTARGNGGTALVVQCAAGCTVGGTTAADRNVVAASTGGHGIDLQGAGSVVQGNFIGTDASGTVARGSATLDGIQVAGSGHAIGGTAAGAGNVISGNGRHGIAILAGASGLTVAGNFVGTNAAGTAALANAQHGVLVQAAGITIGGTAAGSLNLVSGNGQAGVRIEAGSVTVQGNRIGTNAAGTAAVPNGSNGATNGGVWVVSGAGALVGGSAPGAGNLLSGNGGAGVWVEAAATGTVIQGNTIGTNAAGSGALGNGRWGVVLNNTGTQLGGTAAGAGNLISGNTGSGVGGVYLIGTGHVLEGNRIGLTLSGAGFIPNGSVGGVEIRSGSGHRIGGTAAGAGNQIAGNTGAGVAVNDTATGNAILGNAIWGNSGLGIDLGGGAGGSRIGVNANDGAKTAGASNLLMDHPVFTAASLAGDQLVVAGYVGSAANQSTFAGSRVEVFVSDDDASGFGEGRTYLGSVTADASGNFSGRLTVPGTVTLTPGSTRLTGTATDAGNNTSEFGANAVVTGGIAGRVFEDLNYGGGAGRGWAAASANGAQPVAGARVEVYRTSDGAFVAAATTAADGSYVLPAPSATTHTVRVVVSTVQSTRAGSAAGLWPVLTYRAAWSGGGTVAVADNVGGNWPAAQDAAANTTNAAWSTLVASASSQPNAFSQVAFTAATDTAASLDFGFNFSTVVNTADSGQGSLRQAITNANTLGGDAALAVAGRTAGIEHLVFMIPNGTTGSGGSLGLAAGGLRSSLNAFVGGAATVQVATPLPTVTQPLVLDAQTQPGWTAAPVVEIDGRNTTGSNTGLMYVTAGNSAVRGFAINRSSWHGLWVTGDGNRVQGNWIGLAPNGSAAPGVYDGLVLTGTNHLVGGTAAHQGNVFSGNGRFGVYVWNGQSGGAGIVIAGNRIGTNPSGTAAVANGSAGLWVALSGVRIGGAAAGEGNLISGNAAMGISLAVGGTTVQGNWIGTDVTGTSALANGTHGVYLAPPDAGATATVIGGAAAGQGNVISGNAADGVVVAGSGAGRGTGTRIEGNRIGTNAAGTAALRNTRHGVYLWNVAAGVSVGGSAAGAGNLISGNGAQGIQIEGDNHVVEGNLIGLNAAGTAAVPNAGAGVNVGAGSGSRIGGAAAGAGNTISGNTGQGVYAGQAGNLQVLGNRIGTNASGTAAVPNGVGLRAWSTTGLVVGGTAAGAGNVISGNTGAGLYFDASNTGTRVQGNLIGRNAANTAALGNGADGVTVISITCCPGLSAGSAIGGTAAGSGNVIAHNAGRGINLIAPGAAQVPIQGNAVYGNGGLGIDLGDDGVTANDGARTAGQPNQRMDHPVFTSARARGSQLTVAGHVGSAAGQATFADARVEIFESDNDATGFGEGRSYLGFVTTDAQGNFSGTVTMPVAALRIGTRLTGTATDAAGNTSEFGANFAGLIVDQVVNDNGDAADATPGDGLCATAAGVCTLRAALQEFNAGAAQSGPPTVAFALPGCTTGAQAACVVTPGGNLPFVTRPMQIDATTQPGFAGTPMVAISGATAYAGTREALRLDAGSDGSTVRGLRFAGWAGAGDYALHVFASTGHTVAGNWFGLSADGGGAPAARNRAGVAVRGGGQATIGGAVAADRNVVANSTGWGVYLYGGSGSVVRGNWFGLAADGATAAANTVGVAVYGAGAVVGGNAAGDGNLFGANTEHVRVDTNNGAVPAASATVQGNRMGYRADGTAVPAPSSVEAVVFAGVASSTLGGTADGAGNAITGASVRAVGVHGTAQRVTILGNAMAGNGTLGIDLDRDGVTANDGATNPAQANGGMDAPVVGGAGIAGTGDALTVYGHIGTGTGQALFAGARVEVFTAAAGPAGFGEGRTFLGALTADANGRFGGTLSIPVGAAVVGDALTATATDAAGNTSEFGPNWIATTLAALAPSRFNAFETDTAAASLTGAIRTMTAGVPRTLALVAVDAPGTGLAPAFAGSVQVQWVDASAGGAPGADGCEPAWPVVGTAATVTFSAGQPRTTVAVTPPDAGRQWRLRFEHTTAFGATVRACSTDAFAVRPAQLVVAAVGSGSSTTAALGAGARALDHADPAGGVVHRAGRPFALQLQARGAGGTVTAGYDGAARLVPAACVLPASGCRLGTLRLASTPAASATPGQGPTLPAATGGTASTLQLVYDEVGAIRVRLEDDDFAAVDAGDTPLADRRVTGPEQVIGRFVPDRYAVAADTAGVLRTAQGTCTAAGGGHTFFGQPFGWAAAPTAVVTALNADGATTENWTGALQRLDAAAHVGQQLTVAGVGAALSQSHGTVQRTDLGAGRARLAAAEAAVFALSHDPAAPRPSATPTFGLTWTVDDASEDAVPGNGRITGTGGQPAVAFDRGGAFHSGRLVLAPSHGDARSGVRLVVELQRLATAGWVTMTEDAGCLTVQPAHLAVRQGHGALAGAQQCAAPPAAGAVTLRGGRGWIAFAGTPAAQPGRLEVSLNVGTTVAAAACTAGGTVPGQALARPWLQLVRAGVTGDPHAMLTWGRPNRDLTLRREQF